jgi:hypothetical protein
MESKFAIIFHPEAEKEYLDSVKWYEDALIGLGEEFVEEIERIFDQISINPFCSLLKN